jgi:hypothetical protein
VIERYQISPNQPPMYKIKGRTCLYTRNQLQVVNVNAKLPPETVQNKFVIDKLVGKKKINNRVHYQVKWKNYAQTTWEPRSKLIEDTPELINDYENTH